MPAHELHVNACLFRSHRTVREENVTGVEIRVCGSRDPVVVYHIHVISHAPKVLQHQCTRFSHIDTVAGSCQVRREEKPSSRLHLVGEMLYCK